MAEKKKKPYEIGELDQYLFGQDIITRFIRSWVHIWYRTENKKVCILRYGHRMHRQFR